MGLSQKAILAHVSISLWAGRKQDSRATGKVEESFATVSDVGNYSKKLLPGAVELELVKSVSSEARKFFATNTLPWLSNGGRIVSSKNYFELTQELRKRKDSFDRAVVDFLAKYSQLRIDARSKLGNLFSESDYPTTEKLSRAFSFDVTFLPIPEVSDFRTEVLDSEREEFTKKMKEIETGVLRDCYSRLKEVVGNAASRLNIPEARINDSLLENISEICTLIEKLNATDDATLSATTKDVQKVVASISLDVCRENKVEKDAASKKLSEINEKMNSIMGGL